MKESIASTRPEIWNQKNLPSADQGEPSRAKEVIEQLPSAVVGLARRRPGILILAAAGAVGILGLLWYFSSRD